MSYEFVPAGQFVFCEGDLSNDKFYIVLSGTVSVILKSDPNVFMKENIVQSFLTKRIMHQIEQLEQEDTEKKQRPQNLPLAKQNALKKTDQSNAIKRLSAFARSLGKFSNLNRKVKEKRSSADEDKHMQKIKHKVEELKELGRRAFEEQAGTGKLQEAEEKLNQALNELEEVEEEKEPHLAPPRKKTASTDTRSTLQNLAESDSMVANFGVVNKEINEGDAFGERALTSKDARRAASILAKTDCEFIILMKKDYLNITGKYNKENKIKLEFLKQNLPFVARITTGAILEDYLYMFKNHYLHRSNNVMVEEKDGDSVFMLVEGECRLERRLSINGVMKTVLIAHLHAPAILGEELLFESRNKKYKYTIKVTTA